ncbi:PREDICTED: uncharacterized protein LOC108970272 isoform X2 [Bactrocera latifrons]|uniref:uncharacterized protein LOC108970272 isoform X2 n=1 Tax=Bactrocera latifrons TaxID=174628 RepID=UPI0008DC9AFF|nr:PREDICTED: uncharacterized protein LOC108970272 isoform X2 [Bactrocera latifrons]
MGKQRSWLDYRLVLLLTGVACAFEVDQPFAIHLDVRRTLDDSMRIGKSCERKMSAMDSFLEIGKQAELNLVSVEKVENLEKRLNSCVLKHNALENTMQSMTTTSKETIDELKENVLKLRSSAADLASKIESG